MIAENSSALGYVFIIIGISLAIVAYVIYLNLREEKSVPESSERDHKLEEADVLALEHPTSLDTTKIEAPSDFYKPPPLQEEAESKIHSIDRIDNHTGVIMSQKQNLVEVVTILREIDSGDLILQIGERMYHSLDDLKDSPHLPHILRLSSDLNNWLRSTPQLGAKVEKSTQQIKAKETAAPKPKSMVEEINEILERMLKDEPASKRAIKLVEMPGGGVNVYIGVENYPMDEVPSEDVRQLIRQAVAEWEQRG